MLLKEFAKILTNREYDYPQYSKEELQVAKDNNFVIVSGASDDLVEFEGAICSEGDCWEGGTINFEPVVNGRVLYDDEINSHEHLSFEAKWCKEKDNNNCIIPWTYDVPFKHEDFIIYEDGKPYCRGFVFSLDSIKRDK